MISATANEKQKRAIDEDFLELQPWGGLATMQPNGQFEWRQFLH